MLLCITGEILRVRLSANSQSGLGLTNLSYLIDVDHQPNAIKAIPT